MGLHIVKPDLNIDFIGKRKIAYALSGAIMAVSLLVLILQGGPKYGIDFAGGMIVQLKFQKAVEVEPMRASLDPLNLPGLVIQRMGGAADNEYLVRTSITDQPAQEIQDKVTGALNAAMPDAGLEVQRLEMVGPKVGADLRAKALEAMYYAVLLISIYISGRFEQRWMVAALMAVGLFSGVAVLQYFNTPTSLLILAATGITLALCWKLHLVYAMGAAVALIHDVLITVGVLALLGKEFDLTVIAAILTIAGYSLNDTIIVYDRIRERLKDKGDVPLEKVINVSVNQTVSRTLLTGGTTIMAVLSLYFLGGGVIHDFALTMFIGILVGTYSSVYVASPVLLAFGPQAPADQAPVRAAAKA